MNRLLVLAEWLCGADARKRVLEPLVADWYREWRDASGMKRLAVVVHGFAAFALTLLQCASTAFISMPPRRAAATGLAAFAGAMLVAIAADAVASAVATAGRYPVDILVRYVAAPMALPLAIPLAMLPLMMLVRRDARATRWHAAQFLILGTVLSVLGVWASQPPAFNRFPAEWDERMYQRALANDRAGRLQYPGTAYRQHNPSTPAQRAERRASFEKEMAGRNPFPRAVVSWPRRLNAMLRAPVLAIAFGLMGWALAALGRTRLSHAVLWWMLAWTAMQLMIGRPNYLLGYSSYIRVPYWMPTLVFVTAALALQIASARKAPGTQP